MGILKKTGEKLSTFNEAVSPVNWLGKIIGVLFSTRKLYFNKWAFLALITFIVGFTGYVYWAEPSFFTQANPDDPLITNLTSVYSISMLIAVIFFVVMLLGSGVGFVDKLSKSSTKELHETMKELANAYDVRNELLRKLKEVE